MAGQGIILFSFLTFTIGIVAVVVASLGAQRTGDPYRVSYVIFLTTFTVSVFLYLVHTYVRSNLGEPSVTFLAVWGSLDGLVDLAVVVTAIRFFHSLYEVPFAVRIDRPLLVVSAIVSVVFVFSGVASIRSQATPVGTYVALAYYYLLFGYLIVLNLVRLHTLMGARRRFFGYGLFIFALVGAVEGALSIPRLAGATITDLIELRRIYFSTVPYLLWALGSTIVLWTADHRPSGGVDLDAYCKRYRITAREREILAAISRGLSNQEIADTLFISLQTVKTHAHHLYEKTDTTGRTSLLASIQSLE